MAEMESRLLVDVRRAVKRVLGGCAAALVAAGMSATDINAQTLATYEISDGWATFGLALPAGAAGEGVRVGNLLTQTDVKTRWPDGSIRFAVVTVRAPNSGAYPI